MMDESRLDTDRILARLPRHPGPGEQAFELRVTAGIWRGHPFCEARFWSMRGDQWVSTGKFLRVRGDELGAVAAAFQEAARMARDANPDPRPPQERAADLGRVGSHGDAQRGLDVT
jgi:hypothetical protein